MFLLVESRHIPGAAGPDLAAVGAGQGAAAARARYTLIDLDLSKYDSWRARFQQEQREGLSFLKAGIDTRNAAFNRLIERIEQVAIALARAAAAHRAHGRGQVAARAAHLRAEEGAAAGERARFVDSTAPRCAGTGPCPRCSAT